jgi:hypothetical protein
MYVLCTYYVIFLPGVYLSTIQSLLDALYVMMYIQYNTCTLYKLSCVGERKRTIAKNFAWATAFFCTVIDVSLFCNNIAVTRAGHQQQKRSATAENRILTPDTSDNQESTTTTLTDTRQITRHPTTIVPTFGCHMEEFSIHLSVLARDTAKVLACFVCFIGNFRLTRIYYFLAGLGSILVAGAEQ